MNVTDFNASVMAINTHEEAFDIFVNVLMMLTLLLIVTLNPLCLLALHRTSGIQETTKIFMASLTVSDICSGIFVIIPKLTQSISKEWILGDFLCTVWGALIFLFGCMMIISLLLLTIDRYIAIIHSLRYPSLVTMQRSKVTLALSWTLAAIICILLITLDNRYTVKEGYCVANIEWYSIIFKNIMAVILCIILALYVQIFKVARRQARLIAAQNQIGNPPGGQNAPQRISTKSAMTVFIITGSVCLCWVPTIIINVSKYREIEIHQTTFNFMGTIFYTNSWLNVVIYYWRNRELRQALHSLVTSCCH